MPWLQDTDANLKALAEHGRPALIADNQMRKRDERFEDQGKYKALPVPLYDKAHPKQAAPHYPPGMLLKVVLFAYSRGIVSSRKIERACRDQVTFIALSGDSAPHYTTFAAFVSTLGKEIVPLFKDVLLICDRMGLIGREMFAIDGVKLPGNASKANSDTQTDFQRQAAKMEAAANAMLARHRANDARPVEPDLGAKESRSIQRLTREAAQMRQWLTDYPDDRKGAKGKVIKSNRTDPDSAKMATSKGVIQGYTGVAAVDDRHQIIVDAQAHGTGSEQALLMPMVDAIASLCTPDALITADAGYCVFRVIVTGDFAKA